MDAMINCLEKAPDFTSHLWSSIKYDDVLRDLAHYYTQYHTPNADDNFTKLKQNAYNHKHSSYPSNCFTYATGLIAKGDTPADPFYLNTFDFSDAHEQRSIVSNAEYYKGFTPSIASDEQFKKAMIARGLKSLNGLNSQNCQDYNPIIALIAKNDYHFVKVDFCKIGNETKVILSHRMTKIPPSCNTLQEYAEGYNEFYGAHYHYPQLLFSPKTYVNRVIEINNDKNGSFKVTLHALKQ